MSIKWDEKGPNRSKKWAKKERNSVFGPKKNKKTRFLLKQSHSILAQNNGTILRWGEFGVALPQAGGRAAHAPTRTVKL